MKLRNNIILSILLIVIGITIYSNSFFSEYHFDDSYYIQNNTAIRKLTNFRQIWDFEKYKTRVVAFYSFAINYFLHRYQVFGYHLFNFLIHLINSFLTWILISQLFSAWERAEAKEFKKKKIVSFVGALFFLVHPLQIQAVTYLSQRFASLATLFYLLALCLYLKGRLSFEKTNRYRLAFYMLSGISAFLGMFTKETVFTLPVIFLLIEIFFFNKMNSIKGFLKFFKENRIIPAVIIAFLLIIPTLFHFNFNVVMFKYSTPSQSHQGDMITFSNYFITQFRVMATYIRLLVMPMNQNLDYDYPVYNNVFCAPVLLSLGLIVFLFYLAIKLSKKNKLITFGILWFFVTSSVESSIIPIRHVIFEHRMYLPAFGFCLVAAEGLSQVLGDKRKYLIVVLLIASIFSVATYRRNNVWKTEFSLWEDVVKKSPRKARGYQNLGLAYLAKENYKEAKKYFDLSLKYYPLSFQVINNLGGVYQAEGNNDKAIEYFSRAIDLNSDFEEAYVNRAAIYIRQEKHELALKDLNDAIRFNKRFEQAYLNRAYIFIEQKKYDLAIADYQKALELNPNYAEAFNGLGVIYKEQGEYDLALTNLNKALALDASISKTYNNRGNVYSKKEKLDLALNDFNQAIKLDPRYSQAYNNRGLIYKKMKEYNKAIDDFNRAILIDDKFSAAFLNRANTLRILKKNKEALADYDKAISLESNSAVFYYNRSLLFAELGKYSLGFADAKRAKELGYQNIDEHIARLQYEIKKNGK